jgi:hypothetical protein
MTDYEPYIHELTKNTRYVSYLTSISLLVIFLLYFYPNIHIIIKLPIKTIIIGTLFISFILLFRHTNIAMQNIDYIFINPDLLAVRNNLLLSYLYSFFILILIYYLIKTLFY